MADTKTEKTVAEELRAAAKVLRESLPPFLAQPPAVVLGESDSLSALAWCDLSCTEKPEGCDCALYADMVHHAVTELTASLLAAREPLASWLESWDGVELREDGPLPDDFAYALRIARVLNGTAS